MWSRLRLISLSLTKILRRCQMTKLTKTNVFCLNVTTDVQSDCTTRTKRLFWILSLHWKIKKNRFLWKLAQKALEITRNSNSLVFSLRPLLADRSFFWDRSLWKRSCLNRHSRKSTTQETNCLSRIRVQNITTPHKHNEQKHYWRRLRRICWKHGRVKRWRNSFWRKIRLCLMLPRKDAWASQKKTSLVSKLED